MGYEASLVCVYNDKKLAGEMVASIERSGVDAQIVLVDNREHEHKSASEALNYGATLAEASVIVFLHQDVEFVGASALRWLIESVDRGQASTALPDPRRTEGVRVASSRPYGKAHVARSATQLCTRM